ncbi:hypothetical protein CALCODRAFT_241494 [Calocera cornea HHB12733]|uniref:Uncharacterized protein n=1 Tax=Calocera cornea HHB12733 TaxID=1353952 RepID=A0A165GNX6_9BASI|nr:hypothetical protein CALCODRAFT_241494 [Calocera cornea HHB12733]
MHGSSRAPASVPARFIHLRLALNPRSPTPPSIALTALRMTSTFGPYIARWPSWLSSPPGSFWNTPAYGNLSFLTHFMSSRTAGRTAPDSSPLDSERAPSLRTGVSVKHVPPSVSASIWATALPMVSPVPFHVLPRALHRPPPAGQRSPPSGLFQLVLTVRARVSSPFGLMRINLVIILKSAYLAWFLAKRTYKRRTCGTRPCRQTSP